MTAAEDVQGKVVPFGIAQLTRISHALGMSDDAPSEPTPFAKPRKFTRRVLSLLTTEIDRQDAEWKKRRLQSGLGKAA